MTRTDIEKKILALPARERIALAKLILGSLGDERQQELRARLSQPPTAEFSDEVLAQVEAGFNSGESREWTNEDWDALKRGEYRHPPDPDSWAIPAQGNGSGHD